MKNVMKGRNKGITLIALVVTIIVLIILAGVSINLILSENGIIQRTKAAKIEQTKAQILEALELAKSQVMFEGEGYTDLEKYLNYIDGKELNGFKVKTVEKIDEANEIIWVDEKYKYTVAQVGIDVIINAEGYFEDADVQEPSNAEITIQGEKTQSSLPITLTATIVQTDEDSGINIPACKYILNQSAEKLGTESSKYSEKFTSDNETITIKLTEIEDWYLHVLTTDNEGNAIETIKGPITVKSTHHTHTGSSSTGGGCYTNYNTKRNGITCTHYQGRIVSQSDQNGNKVNVSCGTDPGGGNYNNYWQHFISTGGSTTYYTLGCGKQENQLEYIVSY